MPGKARFLFTVIILGTSTLPLLLKIKCQFIERNYWNKLHVLTLGYDCECLFLWSPFFPSLFSLFKKMILNTILKCLPDSVCVAWRLSLQPLPLFLSTNISKKKFISLKGSFSISLEHISTCTSLGILLLMKPFAVSFGE